jgi:hypothetical protein
MSDDKVQKELDDLFDELDELLKNPEMIAYLTARTVNTSLAMVAADGLRAYLHGDKMRAAEDLSTVAEEIRHRVRLNPPTTS